MTRANWAPGGAAGFEFSGGRRSGTTALMWCVVGHEDPDTMRGGKCGTCGAVFNDWREKVSKQGAAFKEDCCKGFTLTKSQGRRTDA